MDRKRKIDELLARSDALYAGSDIIAQFERELVCRSCGYFHDELTCPRWAFEVNGGES